MSAAEIFKRAWADTLAFFGWNVRTLLLSLLFPIGALLHFALFGWQSTYDQLASVLTFTVLPFGIGALILFDWNLTVAPGKIAYEAATKAKGANPVGEQPKFIGPPSRHWRSVRSLLTWQAACLVENVEPKWPIQDGDLPYAAMTALDTAIKDGVLHADSPSDYSGMSRIEKSDFIAYCRQLGEAPPIYEA